MSNFETSGPALPNPTQLNERAAPRSCSWRPWPGAQGLCLCPLGERAAHVGSCCSSCWAEICLSGSPTPETHKLPALPHRTLSGKGSLLISPTHCHLSGRVSVLCTLARAQHRTTGQRMSDGCPPSHLPSC